MAARASLRRNSAPLVGAGNEGSPVVAPRKSRASFSELPKATAIQEADFDGFEQKPTAIKALNGKENPYDWVEKPEEIEEQKPSPGQDQYQPRTMAYFHRPSSVSRLSTNAAVTEFHDWASTTPRGWELLQEMILDEGGNPTGGRHVDSGHQGIRGVTKRKFIRLLLEAGYPNEASLPIVFDEIAKEEFAAERKARGFANLPEEDLEIGVAQLKRFQRRITAVNCTLSATHEQSPAGRFVRFLTKRFGSSLVAWRTQLDLHGRGRVPFVDFAKGCRKLGFEQQGRQIWNNLQKDKVEPLEFRMLDPVEGENLERFAELLWTTVGFDMNKAWQFLDVGNQRFLSWEEFQAGVERLGFDGDIKLLFKGLDTSRVGRIKREDFDYVAKASAVASMRLGSTRKQATKTAVVDLVAFAQREMGGAVDFIVTLGLGNGSKTILVSDLAARLTALGFEGDALKAAAWAARAEGGTSVSAEALYALLTSERPRPERQAPVKSGANRAAREEAERAARMPRMAWCDAVDNISEHNKQRCKYSRGYFDPPARRVPIARDQRSPEMSSRSIHW